MYVVVIIIILEACAEKKKKLKSTVGVRPQKRTDVQEVSMRRIERLYNYLVRGSVFTQENKIDPEILHAQFAWSTRTQLVLGAGETRQQTYVLL